MTASRMQNIRPFYVMEVLEKAFAMERAGKPVIHLEVGEPDFSSPPKVVAAGIDALKAGRTRYVQATGLPELKARIAEYYPVACRPSTARVVVTPGSSSGLQLVFASLLNSGDEVLLSDPGYPCNANFVHLYGGVPVAVACDAGTDYGLTAEAIRSHWSERTRAVLIGSPSNPAGTVVSPAEMSRIAATVRERGATLIVDEIYHGLVYDTEIRTALYDGADIFVVNSFSKYYSMTGWRLGWLVVPENRIDDITRLCQNLFISSSTPAQYAALRAFDAATTEELERRRVRFQARRDFLVPALRALGFKIPVMPQGAFYVYADCSGFSEDSDAFALEILEQALVGIAPGKDFGRFRCNTHVRFSYANTLENLRTAVERIAEYLRANHGKP